MNLFDEIFARYNALPDEEKERLAEAAKSQAKHVRMRHLRRCDWDAEYNADYYDPRAKWHEPPEGESDD